MDINTSLEDPGLGQAVLIKITKAGLSDRQHRIVVRLEWNLEVAGSERHAPQKKEPAHKSELQFSTEDHKVFSRKKCEVEG